MVSPLQLVEPSKAAIIVAGTGHQVTFGELERRSANLANFLKENNLGHGSQIAVLLENHPRYFEACWAAQRSGMYYTPVNSHLSADEAGYIIRDCEATVLITSKKFADRIEELEPYLSNVAIRLSVDEAFEGFKCYDSELDAQSKVSAEPETEGAPMFYSSGTTGFPKGIKPALPKQEFGAASDGPNFLKQLYGLNSESIYLSPAPLYHAAPLSWSMAIHRLGGTVVIMKKFDAKDVLETITRQNITHAQFVPTHFKRMLKLPKNLREKFKSSSLEMVIHAAAPCPKELKQEMLDWWGPIIHEYYGGSEKVGYCTIGPQEWLKRPGSVGKSMLGQAHIVDADNKELEPGEVGQIWFEAPSLFEYHNDPEKTKNSLMNGNWGTYGDVGYMDKDGYLFLTDRVSNMIISGGVNIYPQEVENILSLHPSVYDVAVIGVPSAEFGEEVQAVVQLTENVNNEEFLSKELIDYCRSRLSHFKCPKSVRFIDKLPRTPTGKLVKRLLKDKL